MLSAWVVISGGRRIRQIWPPEIFLLWAYLKERFTNNVPKFWKLWRRRYDRKLLPLNLKWFSRSRTTTERGCSSVSIFKAATWVMFCSKHVDVKRHAVYFPEIKKPFALVSLVLNLLASQIGDFFLSYPVLANSNWVDIRWQLHTKNTQNKTVKENTSRCNINKTGNVSKTQHWGSLAQPLLPWGNQKYK